MVNVNTIRRGDAIILDNELYVVLNASHHKPGKGQAVMRTKIRNVKKGSTIDKTFTGGEKVEEALLTYKHMQFLYKDENEYIFMDLDNYEQIHIGEDIVASAKDYMLDGTEVDIQFYEEEIISVNLPIHVVLKVDYTEPGFKGDTPVGSTKPATLETGINVNVPLFIEIGTKIKVDTRDNSYVERVKD